MRKPKETVEPKKTIPFRPGAKLRERLQAEKDRTDAPFQKIIERALDEYLASRAKRGA